MVTNVLHTYGQAIITTCSIHRFVCGFSRFSRLRQKAHGWYDRSAEDAHATMEPDSPYNF